MSTTCKTVTVFGATGNQGGAVVRSLLANPDFRVRAVTRNPRSERSQALQSLGAEIVQADGFDGPTIQAAFEGSWGAFVNINSGDKTLCAPNGPTEFDLGKSIVDNAQRAGVQHLVFSSGPSCTGMTQGQVRMPAMDMKYKIDQYIRQEARFTSFVPIVAGWYLESIVDREVARVFGGFPYFPDKDGVLTFKVPKWGGQEDVPWLSISDDFGDIVQGIFLQPERWSGQVIQALSDIRSFEEVLADFADVTRQETRFDPVLPSWREFDVREIHELEEIKLMFGFTQITGGHYFGPEPTQNRTAAELKRVTCLALGQEPCRAELVTVKEWFRARFPSSVLERA